MQPDILLINKPSGWTSFDVVAKIRGQIKAGYTAKGEKPTKRQLRVGHAGTLDPFATGLLIILLGEACKKASDFLKLDKTYEATITLGQTSTTGDPEGDLTVVSNRQPTNDEIQRVLNNFCGEIQQIPPAYSAVKIGGQRAYNLARNGEVFEMPVRTITIYSLELLDYPYPNIQIRTHVSSGTYIRTLAEDIGKALKTGAYCSALRRTAIANYKIEDALTIDRAIAKQR